VFKSHKIIPESPKVLFYIDVIGGREELHFQSQLLGLLECGIEHTASTPWDIVKNSFSKAFEAYEVIASVV
jgi:hypothetical protein